MKIVAAKKILKANDQLAEENRAKLDAAGVFGVNVVGSPGAGKTTLLEVLIKHFNSEVRPAVIEGDIAGSIDAERIEALGVPVVQINTQGACHLDARMITADFRRLVPGGTIFQVAAIRGEGIPAVADWLAEEYQRPTAAQKEPPA